jgi:DNA-binding CsgD family transcriptional regulator
MMSVARPAWLDGIGVPAWVTAPDRTIRHMNVRAESLLECAASECVGRPCYDVLGARTRWVSPRGTARRFCRLHCPIQNALARSRELPHLDLCVLGAEGRRWVHLLPIPVTGNDGVTLVVHCALPADKERRLESYIAHVARRSLHPLCPGCLDVLSPREKEVARLLAEDLTLEEIAERLGVSYVTVRNHVQHVLAKLGAHSTAEAIAVYLLEQ